MKQLKIWGKRTLLGFKYAASGFIYALRNERNIKIHILAAGVVILFILYLPMTTTEAALLITQIGLVISAELFNTATERLTDTLPDELDKLRGIIKDISAAAVLVLSITSAVVGAIILLPYILSGI